MEHILVISEITQKLEAKVRQRRRNLHQGEVRKERIFCSSTSVPTEGSFHMASPVFLGNACSFDNSSGLALNHAAKRLPFLFTA